MNYFLGVGIDSYHNLGKTPSNMVEDFSELEKQLTQKYDFYRMEGYVLLNEKATKAHFLEKLQQLNPRKITLIRITGGKHNNLPTFPEYHNFIRDILQY